MKLVHQEIKNHKLGFEMKIFHNFVQLSHQDSFGFKEKSKHESCSTLQNLQLLFTKFP